MFAIRRLAALSIASFLFVLAAPLALADERVFDKKFPATAGGTLTLDTDHGSIIVTGGDVREVTVHVTMSGQRNQLRDFEVTADSTDGGVTVRGKRYGDWWFDLSWLFGDGFRARFEVKVPRDYHVDLRTSGGSIESRDISGKVYGRTSGGSLTLASINGDIDVHTSGGRITANNLIGNALLRTSGGSITVTDTKADLSARTSGGSIRLDGVEGRVDARTSGGSIDANIRGANEGVSLRTSGGSIRIEIPKDFKATVDARTSGGRVNSEIPVTASRYSDDDDRKNSLQGNINGGGETLYARTSGGSVRIRARE